jgi:hypothetical protein
MSIPIQPIGPKTHLTPIQGIPRATMRLPPLPEQGKKPRSFEYFGIEYEPEFGLVGNRIKARMMQIKEEFKKSKKPEYLSRLVFGGFALTVQGAYFGIPHFLPSQSSMESINILFQGEFLGIETCVIPFSITGFSFLSSEVAKLLKKMSGGEHQDLTFTLETSDTLKIDNELTFKEILILFKHPDLIKIFFDKEDLQKMAAMKYEFSMEEILRSDFTEMLEDWSKKSYQFTGEHYVLKLANRGIVRDDFIPLFKKVTKKKKSL